MQPSAWTLHVAELKPYVCNMQVAEVLGAPKSNIVAIPKELSAAVRKGTPSHDFAGAFQSQPEEYDYWIDEIEGTLPETLRGTLFRNGPGNFGALPKTLCCDVMLCLDVMFLIHKCSTSGTALRS